MKKIIIYSIVAVILVVFIISVCKLNKFTKGVVDDANRMDTTEIPTTFNIDSINKTLDTLKVE